MLRPLRPFALSLALALPAAGLARADEAPARPAPRPPAGPVVPVVPEAGQAARAVDLALCIDVSGSMNGLLDATQRKLWELCTLLAQAQPAPRLRVALYTFGGGQNADDGYVVQEVPFTDELDRVYERLIALQASGGTEYVGRVVRRALDQLAWSDDPEAVKLCVVAGNESADQDAAFPFVRVAQDALQRSVVVHAIFCGPDGTAGDPATWRELARWGGGAYAAIDMHGTVSVATPFDEELGRLSVALNGTYVAFGAQGQRAQENQARQDQAAGALDGSVAAERARLKGSALYCNGSWDLVDACKAEGFDWAKVEDQDLPEALRGKTVAEKEAYVAARRAERAKLQAEIQALGQKREAFVREALAKQGADAGRSIDAALGKAIRAQAEAKGLRFGAP